MNLGAYPSDLLQDAQTALFLFGAGFLGLNDVIWAKHAEVPFATIVDNDQTNLDRMRGKYPKAWKFICADAFDFIARRDEHMWDVVSADPFMGDSARECREILPELLNAANRAVVLGAEHEVWIEVPRGWSVYQMERSDRAQWAVFERRPT